MGRDTFQKAIGTVALMEQNSLGFGTLQEKTLHAVLKCYFEPDPDKWEVGLGPFIADIANDSGIIEVQTSNFYTLKKKLEFYLPEHHVTIVHPIIQVKWLSWIDDDTGEIGKPRKSPRRGSICDALAQLYSLREYLDDPNLEIRLMLLEAVEYRHLNGWSRNKKKGSTRQSLEPKELLGEFIIASSADLQMMIPEELGESFTAAEFKKAARVSARCAGAGLKLLREIGALERFKEEGRREYFYRLPQK